MKYKVTFTDSSNNESIYETKEVANKEAAIEDIWEAYGWGIYISSVEEINGN